MKFSMRGIFIFALVISIFVAARAQSVWTPEAQVKTKSISNVQISPDGRRVAYAVNEAVMTADRSEFVTQIWLANADGGNAFRLTNGEKSSTNPKFSPDGNWLAFLSNRKDNRNNIFLLPLNGGEAEQLTDVKTSVSNFDWSPDGKLIAFTSGDKKTDEEEKNDKGRNDFRWVDENLKMSRLYVIPTEKDATKRREPRQLTTENYTVDGDFDWSPDGKLIAFSHSRSTGANDWKTADLSLVNVADGKITALARTASAETNPRFSPDGKSIAAVVSDDPPHWAANDVINIFPANGGAPKKLAASFDGRPIIAGWSADGKRIFFNETKGTFACIYAVDVAANKISDFSQVEEFITNVTINRSGEWLGFVKQNLTTAPEAFVSKTDKFTPVQVSRANDEVMKLPAVRTDLIRWKSADGREIEGLLTYPLDYQKGRKVPLILNIHGGPNGIAQQGFIGSRGAYPNAVLASRGFAVLRSNPRGSGGYGKEFRYANVKDWGGADYQDLMAGVDRVIEMGVADPEKLGVMGWSYGGFMTAWIITHTKRFKAASAGAPVIDLTSFTGTADIPSFIPDYFGGQSWEDSEIYQKHSPIFYVKGVSTPTLIQHGEADIRVPISQSYEFYNALKAQNVPTRMLVLPRQMHSMTEPKMQVAVMQSNIDWFEKYLGGK